MTQDIRFDTAVAYSRASDMTARRALRPARSTATAGWSRADDRELRQPRCPGRTFGASMPCGVGGRFLHRQPRHPARRARLLDRPRQRRRQAVLSAGVDGNDCAHLRRTLRRLLLQQRQRRALAAAAAALPANLFLSGWSARAVGGLAARFGNGGQISIGGERSGIGGNFGLWTYRARASVPIAAQ